MPIDITAIIATARARDYKRLIHQLKAQSISGLNVEYLIFQESDEHDKFILSEPFNAKIYRREVSFDYGASSKDIGIEQAKGDYIIFMDDDNIYYPNAISSLYLTAQNHHIGIVRVLYQGMIIPHSNCIKPCEIDTMCFAVKKEIAGDSKWAGSGRYSDYNYISGLSKIYSDINYSKVIIGEHL